jgi:hypothetical protein
MSEELKNQALCQAKQMKLECTNFELPQDPPLQQNGC